MSVEFPSYGQACSGPGFARPADRLPVGSVDIQHRGQLTGSVLKCPVEIRDLGVTWAPNRPAPKAKPFQGASLT